MAKVEYTMTKEQRDRIHAASAPTVCIAGPGGVPLTSSPQENANRAWMRLADELGFVWHTVEPVPGKPDTHFQATPRAA